MNKKQTKILKIFLSINMSIVFPLLSTYITHIGYLWYISPFIAFGIIFVIDIILGIIYYFLCEYLNQ